MTIDTIWERRRPELAVGAALTAQRRSDAAGSAAPVTILGSVAGDFDATFDFVEIEFG